jgi:hypothetical protein
MEKCGISLNHIAEMAIRGTFLSLLMKMMVDNSILATMLSRGME